ncbi:uncharacterized protein LOC110456155 [Mizuhopecten yessoensis]|uniref:uncharacterized protein LOC110456155 n=1 Tax=Mizuhopecten yessoensis TaxID=6573 RepID=UPI000B458635|nr:uncharacterized protein LOC110456155 [Mizuhopecten yessoensis]
MTTEIVEVHNLRFLLEVNFYGEESEDFGGPRKEFFRLAEEAIKTRLCEEADNLKLDDLHVASKTFYVAGIVLGLSAIQGGPCSPIVAYVTSPHDREAHDTELLERKPTFRHLFARVRQDLTVQQLLTLLEAEFSEAGYSKRLNEERTYRMFVKYVRNVAAGRQPGISLGKILSFVTGSEEVPILGVSISPTLSFVELPGGFPTATTCTNYLNLPLNLVEGDMFEKLSMAFMSQYFGMR